MLAHGVVGVAEDGVRLPQALGATSGDSDQASFSSLSGLVEGAVEELRVALQAGVSNGTRP